MNFTYSTQLDVIKSPFNEFFEANKLRHAIMVRTNGEVSQVAFELSEFLQTNSDQDASVCMFSLEEDDNTLFGDDGLFAVSLRSATTNPTKFDYIVAYAKNIDNRFD